jgi:hypothetical protein
MCQNKCRDFKNLQVEGENKCDAVGNCDKIMNIIPVALVLERTIPTERFPLVGEVCVNFIADKECCMVSSTDPYGRIIFS